MSNIYLSKIETELKKANSTSIRTSHETVKRLRKYGYSNTNLNTILQRILNILDLNENSHLVYQIVNYDEIAANKERHDDLTEGKGEK